MENHILQSDSWGEFKSSYGTPAIKAGGVLYTKHKIPFTSYFFAYCPRVNPFLIDFEELKKSLENESCVGLHFDVPNIIKGSDKEEEAVKIFKSNPNCRKSPRDEFAKGNFILDLNKSEDELLDQMHKKHRYNIKYAERSGVVVGSYQKPEDLDAFYKLYKETAKRQNYFPRSRLYIQKIWDTFRPSNAVDVLIAEYKGTPLASWMLFIDGDILYYPYGGSSEEYKNLQASCLIGWEAIKYGKKHDCKVFDMWGAAADLSDESDSYHGFSLFKSKFGAKHVVYIDSYDFVINQALYTMFTSANKVRWKVLEMLR